MKSLMKKVFTMWHLTIVMLLMSISSLSHSLELSTDKIFAAEEPAYVNLMGYEEGDVKVRIYRIEKLKDFLLEQKNIQSPKVKSARRSSTDSELGTTLSLRVNRDMSRVVRTSLRADFRQVFSTSKEKEENEKPKVVELYPVNPNYKLLGEKMKKITKSGEDDWEWSNLKVDFPEAVNKGAYLVEAIYEDKIAHTVILKTDVGLLVKSYSNGGEIVALNRSTGAPIDGVKITVYNNDKGVVYTGSTNQEGAVKYNFKYKKDSPSFVFAEKGAEFSLSRSSYYYYDWSEDWIEEDGEGSGENQLVPLDDYGKAVYIYTERPIYRPGHLVNFKAILRTLDLDENYSINRDQASILVTDSNGDKAYESNLDVNAFGTTTGSFTLSDSAKLGEYTIKISNGGRDFYHYFKVEEYRKPEVEVKVNYDKDLYTQNETINATIKADYFYGSPVAFAEVEYQVYKLPYYHYWWQEDYSDYSWFFSSFSWDNEYYWGSNEMFYDGKGVLDENGQLKISFPAPQSNQDDRYDRWGYWNSNYDKRVKVVATVVDSSRREYTGTSYSKATRGDFYISSYFPKWYLVKDQTNQLLVNLRSYDKSKKDVGANRPVTVAVRQGYEDDAAVVGTFKGTTDAEGKVFIDIKPTGEGFIYFDIDTTDAKGNKVWYTLGRYVYDAKREWMGDDGEDAKEFKVNLDKQVYKVNESATVNIEAPIESGFIYLTVESRKIKNSQIVSFTGGKKSISIPVKAEFAPNVNISASIMSDSKLHRKSVEMVVPPLDKILDVKIEGDKPSYKPGEKASFSLLVKDSKGNPVQSEVSVGVVDSAIYAIESDHTTDIRNYFHGKRYPQVYENSSLFFTFYNYFQKERMASLKLKGDFADAKSDDDMFEEATIRKDFRDTAYWLPTLQTGNDGKANFSFNFPENLTRWDFTVYAISKDTKVAKASYSTIVRKEVIMKLNTPRFLVQGDKAVISGVVNNYKDQTKLTKINVKVDGIDAPEGAEQKINVEKNGVARVDWTFNPQKVTDATFVASASMDNDSDGLQMVVPVLPHGRKIVDAKTMTLGENDKSFETSFELGDDVVDNTAQIEVSLAPSVKKIIETAIPDLIQQPYGCVEQTMSRFLPLVLVAKLNDIMKKQDANLQKKLAVYGKQGIERLYNMQHDDGGWGWWNNDETDRYMTAYVMHGLLIAKANGFDIKDDVIQNGVVSLEAQLVDMDIKEDRDTLIYMLRPLVMLNRNINKYLLDLLPFEESLSPISKSIYAQILHKTNKESKAVEVLTSLKSIAKNEGDAAYFEGNGDYWYWWNDKEETTANVLQAFNDIKPKDDIVDKMLQWMIANRKGTSWRSTKTSSLMIHALYGVAKTQNLLDKNYPVEIYVNDKMVKKFNIDDLSEPKYTISSNILEKGKKYNVKIKRDGTGKSYVATRVSYFKKEAWITSQDQGFKVDRELYKLTKVQKGAEIVYKKEAIKDNTVRSGDTILVDINISKMPEKASYVLIEDSLPAGFEVISNEENYTVEGDNRYRGYKYWSWYYAGKEVHDDKIGISLTHPWSDTYRITYLMKAENPGEYHMLPTRAELMYYPEVYGNADEDKLIVLDRL